MNGQERSAGFHRYRIRIRGHLDTAWSDWFDRFGIAYDGDQTILTGRVADQSALFGLLMKLHELGLAILALHEIPSPEEEANDL